MSPSHQNEPRPIDPRLLRDWPLPQPGDEEDKEGRGRVLVVGGSRELPGAAILAGTAALRAGAGKLRLATPESVALAIATAVPESRVFSLPEAESGAIDLSAADRLVQCANGVHCVLFGPGLLDEPATARLLQEVLPRLDGPTVVIDSTALACLSLDAKVLHAFAGRAVITPHAGEMASCLEVEKAEVVEDPITTARRAAKLFRCVVALKGAETVIAVPDGDCYRNQAGNVGLATSGSGDVLGGLVAGLAARGASAAQAAVWGVHLHARAGDRLARWIGPLGFLARELLDEIPGLMAKVGGTVVSSQ